MTELQMTTTPLAPQPAVSGDYPLSTLCLRLDVDGVMLSWTLRGDDSDVASRLPRILDYIKRLQAKLPKPETPAPAAVPAPPLDEREDWCSLHGAPMLRQENSRGAWYSHKTLEGWCKGKPRRAGSKSA